MKVGAILPHLYVFGGVRRYIELGNALVSLGHGVTMYTPDGTGPAWLDFSGEVMPLDRIDEIDHDVLVCGSPELTGHLDRGRARVRVFYLQLAGVDRLNEIVRCKRYRIMVNSSGLARMVRRRYSIEPIDGIGGVNPELFYPVERDGTGGPFAVLCYGRLSRPRKGTRFVVEAVRGMHRSGRAVELQLFDTITPGITDPRIGFEPGVPYRFYLNLPQSRMAALYAAASVFVSAEHRAGWSNTAAEAAACGLPLVCTKSGTEDFAVDGVSAVVVPFRNSGMIRRALERLYGDRALARRLGDGARRSIMRFTWDAVGRKVERAFQELLEQAGALR